MRRIAIPILVLILLVIIAAGVFLLTRPQGLTTGATLPPDGAYVFYRVNPIQNSSGGDLYAVQPESGEHIQLTQGNRTRSAVLSPDGRTLAVIAREDETRTLSVLDLASGTLTPIDPGVSDLLGSLAWAPDSARLAWEGFHDGQTGIFVSALDGSAPTFVVEGSQPAWSPDGQELLYTAVYEDDGNFDRDISVVNVASGEARRLMTREGPESSPQWSPDGAHLLFVADTEDAISGGVSRQDLYLADADGGNARLVSEVFTFHPMRWSPDGTSVLFDSVGGTVCQAAVDGGDPVCENFPSGYAIWSPSGDQVAYSGAQQVCITSAPIQPDALLLGDCFDTAEGLVYPLGWRP
jgi:Tol biopolymer transport system component